MGGYKKELKRRKDLAKNLPKFFHKCGRFCPWVKKLMFSRRDEYKKEKNIAGFFFGIVLSSVFYVFVIRELDFTPVTTLILTLIIVAIMSIGCAVSSQLRCTSLLIFPSFCGRAGRGALKALVIAYIIAGPVQNLTYNTREVIRSFTCTVTLTYNLTKTRFSLMFKPFQDALMGVKVNTNEVKDTLTSIREVAAPITKELTEKSDTKTFEELNDYVDATLKETKRSEKIDLKYNKSKNTGRGKEIENDYFKKLETQCQGILSAADLKCRRIFQKAEDSCYETLHWAVRNLVCWAMNMNFLCNIVGFLGGSSCDPSDDLPSGFGTGYVYLIDSRQMLSQEFKTARIQYKIEKPNLKLDVRGASDTAKAVIKQFEQKKSLVDSFIRIIKRILTLVFIKIIVDAQRYQDKYLSDITFDNFYITKYFRKIDARRQKAEHHTLLPLKKLEKPGFIDPHSALLNKKEKSQVLSQALKIILEMVTATTIIIMDRLYFESLDLVRRHSKIEFHQSGMHDLIITVEGTGMVAKVVRSIIGNFNFRKKIEENYTNEFCLPKPQFPLWSLTKKIYGTYIIIFLMIILEGYILRMRRVICAFYYPKREKKRVLYLYNQTLKERKGFYRYMEKKIKRTIKDNKLEQDISYLVMLKMVFPKAFGWLGWFENAKRKCLICGERERKPADIYECQTCLYIYCLECWADIDNICYVCSPPLVDDEGSDEEPQPAER